MTATTPSPLDDADRAALLETLRPWMRILRERTFLAGAFDFERLAPTDVVWLRLPATWEVDLRVFEAFELLALAGGVDDLLWRLALSSATTGRVLRMDGGSRSSCTACRVGCVLSFSGIDEFPNAVLAWSARMVSGADPNTTSDEYARARDWLESIHRERSQDGSIVGSKAIEIPVSMWLHEGTFEERMEQLAEVVSMRPPRHDSSTHMASEREWKSLFRVIEVNPGIPDVVTADAFRAMTQIAHQGVMIDKLKPNAMVVTSETAATFAHGLQRLLGSIDQPHAESAFAAVKTVELPVHMPWRTVTALFSALRTSHSVSFLSINCALSPWQPDPDDTPAMTRVERDHLWRWIAFSVFGRYAAHSINQVRINVKDLSAEDVRAFRNQSERAHSIPPGQDGSPCQDISGCAIVSALASARVPIGGDSASADVAIKLAPPEVLIVGAADGETIQVMVPGYGPTYVKTEHVLVCSEVICNRERSVEHLSLENLNERSRDPVLALLQTAGAGITNLSIFHIDCSSVFDDWLCGAIDVCHRLKTLCVHGRLVLRSMGPIAAMLRRGVCGIQHLRLDHLTLGDVRSVEHFFHSLTELSRLSTLPIRHLELTVAGLENAQDGIGIIASVADFLRTNHTMRALILKLSYQPHTSLRPDLWNAAKQLVAHHLQPISVRRAPLGLDKKFAFLSVLASAAMSEQHPVNATTHAVAAQWMRAMDRPLVSIVFVFAAECDRRCVSVRLSKDED